MHTSNTTSRTNLSNAVHKGLQALIAGKNEETKNSTHEAGHAVAARLLGFPVRWVSLDQSFIDADPEAIRSKSTGAGALCMTVSSGVMASLIKQGCIRTKGDREMVVNYCTHVLAGPMAEAGLSGGSLGFEGTMCAQNDYGQIFGMIGLFASRKSERKRLYGEAERKAGTLILRNSDAIERLAKALRLDRTVMAVDIDHIIAGSIGAFAERKAA